MTLAPTAPFDLLALVDEEYGAPDPMLRQTQEDLVSDSILRCHALEICSARTGVMGIAICALLASALSLVGACAPARSQPVTSGPSGPTSSAEVDPQPTSETTPPSTSRYRAGDFIVYRYTGSALDSEVRLSEKVIAREGLKLEIEVVARRGGKERRWIQVVTDTPKNQKTNKVDELFEIVDGNRVKLNSEDPKELYRLYAWVVPPLQGKPQRLRKETRQLMVAGKATTARCGVFSVKAGGRDAEMVDCESDELVWTNALTLITAGSETLYRMDVVDVGRRAPLSK